MTNLVRMGGAPGQLSVPLEAAVRGELGPVRGGVQVEPHRHVLVLFARPARWTTPRSTKRALLVEAHRLWIGIDDEHPASRRCYLGASHVVGKPEQARSET